MSWNENVKRILDFIPRFDREAGKISELSGKLENATRSLEKANKANNELVKRLEKLEGKPEPKPYDDSEVIKMIKAIKPTKPYDDSEVRKMINSIKIPKPYDDSKIIKQIESIKIPAPYDDTKVFEAIKSIEIPEAYNDESLKDSVSLLDRRFESWRKSESGQSARAIAEMQKSLKSLEVGVSKTELLKIVGNIKTPKQKDDTKVKQQISQLDKKVSELAKEIKNIQSLFEV